MQRLEGFYWDKLAQVMIELSKINQNKKPVTQTSQQQTNLNNNKSKEHNTKTLAQHPMEEIGEENSKTPIFQIVKLFFINIE